MKNKGRHKRKPKIYCEPSICDNCIYIGEGDSICEITHEIVLDEWVPTAAYMGNHCPHSVTNKTKKQAAHDGDR